jgi:hypothetical protein
MKRDVKADATFRVRSEKDAPTRPAKYADFTDRVSVFLA